MIKYVLIFLIKFTAILCGIGFLILLRDVYTAGDDIVIIDSHRGRRAGLIKKLLSGFNNLYILGV